MSILPAPTGPLVVDAHLDRAVRFSLVVPTYNESENIVPFLRALVRELDQLMPRQYQVIVVDDESPDGTAELAAGLQPECPQVMVVRRSGESGLAAAVIRGWQVSSGEFIGTINADFQHPPSVLPAMVQHLAQADLVVASRFAKGGGLGNWGLWRRLVSRFAHAMGRQLLPQAFLRTSDPLSGCYLVRRSCIAGIELQPSGFKTLMEILVRGRIRHIREAGYQMRARQMGRSKLKPLHTVHFVRHLFRLRQAAALQEASR